MNLRKHIVCWLDGDGVKDEGSRLRSWQLPESQMNEHVFFPRSFIQQSIMHAKE